MYVNPITDCPHIEKADLIKKEEFEKLDFYQHKCTDCQEKKENWVCLICGEFFCSRYINSHFLIHNEKNKSHNLCLSMMDLSYWCYDCDYYVVSKNLTPYEIIVGKSKFTDESSKSNVKELEEAFELLNIKKGDIQELKYESFIYELKNLKYKKISVLTGAGISTSAGIPDFRSPNNGLFVQLQKKYNLERPEEFFSIKLFEEKPELYYEFSKQFNLDAYEPTTAHWFMRFLEHKKILNLIITQNIDCLEDKTNLSRESILYAHGNVLDAACCNKTCKKEVDVTLINEYIKEGKILYCEKCNSPCKHKVVFYGENLPSEYFQNIDKFLDCDLCIIMGTSLAVAPVSMLPSFLNDKRTLVLINMEKVGHFNFDSPKTKDIFVKGSIDDSIFRIINDCGWKSDFESFVEEEKKNYFKKKSTK